MDVPRTAISKLQVDSKNKSILTTCPTLQKKQTCLMRGTKNAFRLALWLLCSMLL